MAQSEIRDEFLNTLTHVEAIATKLHTQSGIGRPFTFPDQHKLSEGLFLTCWTHWEEFIRSLLVEDLATLPGGLVRRDVRKFRVAGAPRRLAEAILFHPDHPDKFVEWDYAYVRSRANSFLPAGHRFSASLPRQGDLDLLKRIRNAIAHKSDRAWNSFTSLAKAHPFSLGSPQMRGITVGRFLAAHTWNGRKILTESIGILRANASHLVP